MVMVVDYSVDYVTSLFAYKKRVYFLGAPGLETGGSGFKYVGECDEIRYI